jgi:hypothetical protein
MSAYPQSPILITSARHRREVALEGVPERESIHSLSVRASAAFSVSPSRLFYALTIPEYLETWLTPPDADEIYCTGNSPEEPLSIELHRNRRATTSIFAEYNRISAQDLSVRWYFRSRSHTHVSHLRIAIRTVRANALLRIHHSGFVDPSDWYWHQELWGLSLTKMQMVIR